MRGMQILSKHRLAISAGLALLVLLISGAVFAHFGAEDKTVSQSQLAVQAKVDAATTQQTAPAATDPAPAPSPQPDPCSRTVTENNTTSGSNVSNVKKTEITCESQSGNSHSSVNITNDSSQTAQTGDSDGQSGSASNSDNTDTNVNLH